MKRDFLIAIWSWLVISTLLEVVVAYVFSGSAWFIRGSLEAVLGLSAAVPLILFYMGLIGEHASVKMFVMVALFFSLDLILIWTASLVH
jgi:hypothetical protein